MSRTPSQETWMIPAERWMEWSDTFTKSNRGRRIIIEIDSDELGTAPLVDDVALIAIDYDPEGKGGDFVISYGDQKQPSWHVVSEPDTVKQVLDADGRVVSVEIEDQRRGLTVIIML